MSLPLNFRPRVLREPTFVRRAIYLWYAVCQQVFTRGHAQDTYFDPVFHEPQDAAWVPCDGPAGSLRETALRIKAQHLERSDTMWREAPTEHRVAAFSNSYVAAKNVTGWLAVFSHFRACDMARGGR